MMKVNFAYDLLPSLDGAICTVTETRRNQQAELLTRATYNSPGLDSSSLWRALQATIDI